MADRSATIPGSLTRTFSALVKACAGDHPVDSRDLATIARWRLSCGDGRGAARWQRWSLQPPPATELCGPLRELLLRLQRADLAEQIGTAEGWQAVLLALEQQQPELALQRQREAIAAGLALEPALGLRLAGLWQEGGRPEPALQLLLPIARATTAPPLCNAVAHLYEQSRRPIDAAPWWDLSLSLNAEQPAVLMQRSRNALALGDAALAWQLSQNLLDRDAGHAVGLELRVEALQQLGARGSLRQALAPLVRQRRERFRAMASSLDSWWAPRRRRQQPWRLALPAESQALPRQLQAPPRPIPSALLSGCGRLILMGSRDGLELAGALSAAASEGVVWDLASPEPLCSHVNLRRLLPAGWQLRCWSRWQPAVHGHPDVLILASPRLSPPPGYTGRLLRWRGFREGWQEHR